MHIAAMPIRLCQSACDIMLACLLASRDPADPFDEPPIVPLIFRVSEIKDAKLIFNQAFKNVQDVYGRENMKFPKEIIWLMGAPGSGKGTHTPAILRARGITNPPISMSSLLSTPECKDQMNKGLMISDGKVLENLFHALLDCEPEVGVLVDGFPRSEVQVECLKLFHERMHELRREFKHTPLKDFFPRPTFRICVLYVDEEISVSRQLMRGKLVKEHNAQVLRSGKGEVKEERVTDFNELVSSKTNPVAGINHHARC